MRKKIIDLCDCFLVLNKKGQFYAVTDDGYYDGFTTDINSATIFTQDLFFEFVSTNKIDLYSVNRLFCFKDLKLEVEYDEF